jgi:hypothetical protein
MPNRMFITPLVGLILVVAALYAHSQFPDWTLVSKTAGVVGFIVLLWDFYLWRIPGLYPKFVALPDLRGTWKVKGSIYYLPSVRPASDGVVNAKYEGPEGHLVIRQTGSGFRFTALWNSGETSTMKKLSPLAADDEWAAVVGHYQKRNGDHVGISGIIVYSSAHPDEAKIFYTTIEPEPQRGVVELSGRVRQFCDNRTEVAALPLDSKRTLWKKFQFLILWR